MMLRGCAMSMSVHGGLCVEEASCGLWFGSLIVVWLGGLAWPAVRLLLK